MFCSAAQHLSNTYDIFFTLLKMSLYMQTPLAAATVLKMLSQVVLNSPGYSPCNLYMGLPHWKLWKKESPQLQ